MRLTPPDPPPDDAVTWTLVAEADLPATEHPALAALLRRVYPADAGLFAGSHSWAGARPERRVLARGEDGAVVAHLGLVVRALRPGTAPVADVGLVGVEPDRHGRGLGRALLAATDRALYELGVPFGFLTCEEDVVGFYTHGGWHRLPEPAVRMTTIHGEDLVHTGPTLVRPVHAGLDAWPPGPLDRAGTEV